ncbi:MAG: prepilin-type N-terminal cleavage/methylation domain-containing protein, partial [Fimbriimonadaceae bacterium]
MKFGTRFRAFTLIELLVVIAIIAILAAPPIDAGAHPMNISTIVNNRPAGDRS